jgi:hypothetical protein
VDIILVMQDAMSTGKTMALYLLPSQINNS